MAKTAKTPAAKPDGGESFEDRLERLEALGEEIRKTDIPLEEALKAFEEGIRLAGALEKDLEKIETRVEKLMSSPEADQEADPEIGLFDAE